MSGNLSYTLTTYQTELQTRLNAVTGATSNADLIKLGRMAELIPGLIYTTYQAEVQSRLNAVTGATLTNEMLELGVIAGKIGNANNALLETIDGKVDTVNGGITGVDSKVDTVNSGVTTLDGKVDTIITNTTGAATVTDVNDARDTVIAALPAGSKPVFPLVQTYQQNLWVKVSQNSIINDLDNTFWSNPFGRDTANNYNYEGYRVLNVGANSDTQIVNITGRGGYLTHVVCPAASGGSNEVTVTIVADGETYVLTSRNRTTGFRSVYGYVLPFAPENSSITTVKSLGSYSDWGFNNGTNYDYYIPSLENGVYNNAYIRFFNNLTVTIRATSPRNGTYFGAGGVLILKDTF